MPPTKSPASTTAPQLSMTPVPPVKGAGTPMKVPLWIVVPVCIMVPLLVDVAVPLTLAATEEVVELMCLCPPTWAHRLTPYALVTIIAAISKHFAKKRMSDAEKKSDYHFVQQLCNS